MTATITLALLFAGTFLVLVLREVRHERDRMDWRRLRFLDEAIAEQQQMTNADLRRQLAQASKNDHRDARGRFSKADA